MTVQFEARRDSRGWTVFDRWTGKTVVLRRMRQAGLSWPEAEALADRLNRRRLSGDRSILQ